MQISRIEFEFKVYSHTDTFLAYLCILNFFGWKKEEGNGDNCSGPAELLLSIPSHNIETVNWWQNNFDATLESFIIWTEKLDNDEIIVGSTLLKRRTHKKNKRIKEMAFLI